MLASVPKIDFLLSLFERTLKSELCRNNVRISIIGDSSKLPKSLLKVINEVEKLQRTTRGFS
ncbi:BnaC09g53760D [Brassica napus]|uniref:BnaC09g53760D protein n=1 Tax=Brassica napus TaxID=3708 RepID=A0A078JAV1_BRANA|nr:BnaC09g53760D [Brassica napus]